MRVKLDENVTMAVRPLLAAAGHDVESVPDEGLGGASDERLLAACADEDRLLVTFDVGLGDVRSHPPGEHAGVILLRLADQQPAAVVAVIERLLASQDLDALGGALVVVTEQAVRMRFR